jgi:hypothetical protein
VDEPRSGILAGFISEPELAAELGTCIRTLAHWRGLRIGPPHTKIGRETRYSTEAVRAWLVAGGTNGAAPRASMHRRKG